MTPLPPRRCAALALALLAPFSGAVAMPLPPPPPQSGAAPSIDLWHLSPEQMAATPRLPLLTGTSLARYHRDVMFPSMRELAPLPPTWGHEAAGAPRPEPFAPPTTPAQSPFAPAPQAELEAGEEVSVFGGLMRDAPANVREAARYGLRDPLIAGIAVHTTGLHDIAGASGAGRSNPSDQSHVMVAAAYDASKAAENRRALAVIGALAAVAALAMVAVFRNRRRLPRKALSRRYG